MPACAKKRLARRSKRAGMGDQGRSEERDRTDCDGPHVDPNSATAILHQRNDTAFSTTDPSPRESAMASSGGVVRNGRRNADRQGGNTNPGMNQNVPRADHYRVVTVKPGK